MKWHLHRELVYSGEQHELGLFWYWEVYHLFDRKVKSWGRVAVGIDLVWLSLQLVYETAD